MDFTYTFNGKEVDAVTKDDEVVKYAIATIKAQELYPDDRNKRDIAFKVLLSFLYRRADFSLPLRLCCALPLRICDIYVL